jgi:hypothetical protein
VAIRRELALELVELRLQEGNGLAAALAHGKDPNVKLGLRVLFGVHKEPAIPGPLIEDLVVGGRVQQFIRAGPAGRFLVEIEASASLIAAGMRSGTVSC